MHTALIDTSKTLREFLTVRLTALLTGTRVVSLNSPTEIQGNAQEGVSVWLYRVERDSELLNSPPERLSLTQLRREPLPLRLHYLITPILTLGEGSTESEQEMLGMVLQAFHDHPTLEGTDLQGNLSGTAVKLRVRFEPMTLDETAKLRDMLKIDKPYELAVSYEVSVVNIDSALQPRAASPVTVVMPDYGLIPSSEASAP